VLSTAINPDGKSVIVGCGDGTIAMLALPKLNIIKFYKTYIDQQRLMEV
jgi:hypothetical protein